MMERIPPERLRRSPQGAPPAAWQSQFRGGRWARLFDECLHSSRLGRSAVEELK
jgi:hypothetical protein